MSRDFKEQVRATFQGVKREDFEQKVKEFNGLKRKNTNPFSIALGTANFEAYKAEYLKKIKSPYSNKKEIIKSFRNRTNKLLEKREDIYNEILLGNEITIFLADPFDLYRYYTKKHEVIELMKFEEYLNEQENIKTLSPQQTEKPKPELKINQIALKYAYEGLQITRENGNEIAKKYGHNSGEKLFQRFTYYSSSTNRKGKPTPCTPKKLDNKIKLIESIIELLPTDKQGRAKDEVSILKKIYDAEYQ